MCTYQHFNFWTYNDVIDIAHSQSAPTFGRQKRGQCVHLSAHMPRGYLCYARLPALVLLIGIYIIVNDSSHSAVFAGFSATALADRINDSKSKVVFTSDQVRNLLDISMRFRQMIRGGKVIHLKQTVDEALKVSSSVVNVVVHKKTGAKVGRIVVFIEFSGKFPNWSGRVAPRRDREDVTGMSASQLEC